MISYTSKVEELLFPEQKYTEWLIKVIQEEEGRLGEINFVFIVDEELLRMNNEYLGHDYYTDIITFDYSEGQELNGDIFISWDRVRENAKKYEVDELIELRRVMVHGVLHMLGYGDKNEKELREMRRLEDNKLNMFHVEH